MSSDPIKYIGLLRGVNVGGHRKLPMSELGATIEAAGYRGVRTLLASGNFVFEALFYPNGVGVSKLNLKPLGSGTGRNWNTVLKLQAMTAEKA